MRSRASVSASSAVRSQRPSAESISSGVNRKPAAVRVEPVEAAGQLDERLVAARHDVGDDGAHRLLDVLGDFALGCQKRLEGGGEIRGAGIEPDRHAVLAREL